MAERVSFGRHEGWFIAEAADRRARAISGGLPDKAISRASFYIDPETDYFAASSINGLFTSVIKSNPDVVGRAKFLKGVFGLWKKQTARDLQRKAKQNEWNQHEGQLKSQAAMISSLTTGDILVYAQEQLYYNLEIQSSDSIIDWWGDVYDAINLVFEQRKESSK